MTARDDIAKVLYDSQRACDTPRWEDVQWRVPWERMADALLASPALTRLLDEARAEGWDRRDKPHRHGDQRVNIVLPERRNPDDLDHEYGCAGWDDCHCFGYLNPYRKDTP